MMFLLMVVVFTAADTTAPDTNATDYQQLASTMNQDEPNKLACFPMCIDMKDGKREDFWSADETISDEQSARDINKLHPKFRRWLTVEDRPSSSLALPRLVAIKQELEQTSKGAVARDSQSHHGSMTSDQRGGRYQRSRPSLL